MSLVYAHHQDIHMAKGVGCRSVWACLMGGAAHRYEVDKLSASQRLDLNLEKGRMRDELQVLRDKSNEMEIKMDRETNALKAAVEQSKNEVLRAISRPLH